jgi:hypothetical protein
LAGEASSLRRAALLAAGAGGAASLGFMLYAGRRNPSRLLVLLFAAWVLSPFVAAVLAWAKSDQWPTIIRTTLYGTMIVVALGSVCVYCAVALGHLRVKVGFMFLIVPLASWLVLGVAFSIAAIAARRRLNRQTGM